jgi:hypothetical protein
MSKANVRACAAPRLRCHSIAPFMALGRERITRLMQRFAPNPWATPQTRCRQGAPTRPRGRALYALRKSTVEPVIGIIKSVIKFRQFLLRSVNLVSGEWDWVCLAYHVKRMHRMQGI